MTTSIHSRQGRHISAALLALALLAGNVHAGRYETFTAKAAQGDKLQVVSATFFGGDGEEEFVDAGELADGTLVAFGNTTSSDIGKAVVLGRAATPKPGKSGLLVFFDGRLSAVKRIVRFDAGVAEISAACVSRDGKSLFIAGRCTDALRTLVPGARAGTTPESPEPPKGKKGRKPPEAIPVYLAKLSPTGDKIVWAWIFDRGSKLPEQIWTDNTGALYADVRGLVRVSPDGAKADRIAAYSAGDVTQYLAVDPASGCSFYGGDRNSNTGYQPWRQPYMYKFDPAGSKLATLWGWNPKDCACGGNGNGLCSDTSPRAMDVAPNGDLLVALWSDGGNSVATRYPTDLSKHAPRSVFGMQGYGMRGANSLSHLVRIDGKTLALTGYELWVAYCPDNFKDPTYRGRPNFSSIRQVKALADGSLAFAGGAATGLIQTPNAFWKDPGQGEKYGGEFAAVFSPDFSTLLFSSYLPGCEKVTIASTKRGMLLVSRSKGMDQTGVSSPLVSPLQSQKRGATDAHIILLEGK